MPLTLLLPDLTMIGYLGGTRLGSYLYNLGHSTPLPAAIIAIGWWQDKSLVVALGLVWLAHIGVDRLIGYGLTDPTTRAATVPAHQLATPRSAPDHRRIRITDGFVSPPLPIRSTVT